MAKKLRLGTYPYTYVRTTVMRSMLLKKQDYATLQKMKYAEIARFLQDSVYRAQINQFGIKYSGADLLEAALNANLIESFHKLKRISTENLQIVIDTYLRKYDALNLKTLIRAKAINMPFEEIQDLLIPLGDLSEGILRELYKQDDLKRMLDVIPTIKADEFNVAYEEFSKSGNLAFIESVIDKIYYKELIAFSELLHPDDTKLRDYLKTDVLITNLMTFIRMHKHGQKPEKIEKFMIIPEYNNSRMKKLIAKILKESKIENIVRHIKDLHLAKILESGLAKSARSGSLIELETALMRYAYSKSRLISHQNPLSVDMILSYMVGKETEIRNLKALIKGRQLGLDESFIMEQLVV